MKILVAGGFGFIGARLVAHLTEKGHDVYVAARHLPNIPLSKSNNLRLVNYNDFDTLLQASDGIDLIIHAAGMNAKESALDPVSALFVNGLAPAKLISAAIKNRVSKFIYFSTAHVYNQEQTGSIDESNCPQNLHPYATSHRAGEDAVAWADKNGLINGLVLRLSNGFGVPVSSEANCWMLVINDLCMQAVRTGRLVLNSSGKQKRNFIPLSEICSAVEFLSTKNEHTWPIMNIGGANSISILEVAKIIQQRCIHLWDLKPEIFQLTNKDVDVHNLEYKIDRLLQSGYTLQYTLESEIDSLLKYCKRLHENA